MIDNKVNILSIYLNSLRIHIPMKVIQESLDSPIVDTVRGISYALDCLNVKHDVYQIPLEYFDEIDSDFISMLHGDKRYSIVHRVSKNKISVRYSNTECKEYLTDDFLKLWSGIAIVVSPNQKKVFRFTKVLDLFFTIKSNILLITLLLFIGVLCLTENIGLQKLPHILLMGMGIMISYNLLREEYGNAHMRFCKIGKVVDCKKVLHSVKSFRGIKLSDLAFGYFTYMLLLANFCNSFYAQIPLILALLFTLFSIWKQMKIKKICLYCMVINVLLWLDIFWVAITIKFDFDVENWNRPLFALLIAYIVWTLSKEYIKKTKKIAKLTAKGSILYNEDLFNYLLSASPKVEDIDDEYISVFGNKETSLTIIAITHPDCPNCQGIEHEMNLLADRAMVKWISLDHIDDYIRVFLRKYSITQTPTIIVNNHLLPSCYEFRDLKYII